MDGTAPSENWCKRQRKRLHIVSARPANALLLASSWFLSGLNTMLFERGMPTRLSRHYKAIRRLASLNLSTLATQPNTTHCRSRVTPSDSIELAIPLKIIARGMHASYNSRTTTKPGIDVIRASKTTCNPLLCRLHTTYLLYWCMKNLA